MEFYGYDVILFHLSKYTTCMFVNICHLNFHLNELKKQISIYI